MFKKKILSLLACVCLVLTACGGDGTGKVDENSPTVDNQPNVAVNHAQTVANTPTELTVTYAGGTKELFDQRFGDLIRKKFPNYTLKFIETTGKMAEVMATNPSIDIMVASTGAMYSYLLQYELETDISDLIKKYDYDLSKIQPSIVESLKQIGNGAIYGFPWSVGGPVLFYNKDLFDKFGVKYPVDGMTWDEVYALARTMSRSEGDKKYRGLTMYFDQAVSLNQASTMIFDTTKHKSRFMEDDVSQIFQNFARFYSIPGNELPKPNSAPAEVRDLFIKEQTTAMHIQSNGLLSLVADSLANWGVVSYPVLPSHPNVGPGVSPDFIFITKTSKNRDAAFQVLSYIASEEYQEWMSKTFAFLPVLSGSSRVMQGFGENIKNSKTKNLQVLLPKNIAKSQATYKYFPNGQGELRKAIVDYMSGKDRNTVLREAAERMDKFIAEDRAK